MTFYLKYAIMHLTPVGMSVNSSEHWPREIMANESVIKLFLLYLTPYLPVISILDFIVKSSIFGVKKNRLRLASKFFCTTLHNYSTKFETENFCRTFAKKLCISLVVLTFYFNYIISLWKNLLFLKQ